MLYRRVIEFLFLLLVIGVVTLPQFSPSQTIRVLGNQTEAITSLDTSSTLQVMSEVNASSQERQSTAAEEDTIGRVVANVQDGEEFKEFQIKETTAKIRREKRWEALLPPENVPEYRKNYNFNQDCGQYGAARRQPTDPIPKLFFFNTYNGEAHHLEIKLDEAYPVVDFFIVLESNVTFTGAPKPIYFNYSDPRFARYAKKIIHHIYAPPVGDEGKDDASHFRVELKARREAYEAVKHLIKHGDYILQVDVDEIVRREALELLRVCAFDSVRHFPLAFSIRYTWYQFDILYRSRWTVRVRVFNVTDDPFTRNMGPSKYGYKAVVLGAGWHCSMCLSLQQLLRKLNTFSHSGQIPAKSKKIDHIQNSICEVKSFEPQKRNQKPKLRKVLLTMDGRNLQDSDIPMHVIRNAEQFRYMLPRACVKRRGKKIPI